MTDPRSSLSESAVLEEFETFRHSAGFIEVPLALWVPDEGAVAFAWLGKLHNLVLGQASLKMREGILPGRLRGRLVRAARERQRHAKRWARDLPLGPGAVLELIGRGVADAPLAARTHFTRHGRFDLVLAVGDCQRRSDSRVDWPGRTSRFCSCVFFG
jgi:hypothetical protein